MSLDMGVVPSGAELSRAATVAVLGRLFGDDDEDLTEGVARGEFAELVWEGERASTQWSVSAGRDGVREIVVSVADAYPKRPPGVYRAELARVVDLLQELARRHGARFVVEERDLTGASLNAVLDLIAPGSRGPGQVPPAESDEDYLRRYLAAGDQRLARLAGAPVTRDFSRASLGPLWEWAVGFLQLRPDDAPKDRIVLENGSTLRRPRDADLPMWFGRTAMLAPHNWSDESLRMLDAVAWYLAETVRRAAPGVDWQVGHSRPRNENEGQPVLLGSTGRQYEPIGDVLSWLTGKVYYLRRPNPDRPSPPPSGTDLVERFDFAVLRTRG
ncbi:hypothetical protein BJ973_004158 [Actinoplanes tereljensis]|uniref:Uncharacterized protein n=1 Tax=Paractinoplanes tereljensis TaxID=571912 RepID=A0A919NT98_9ACTN|nr:hypothetical protein [Actinoplanes tereljensis]GIF23549.1 hypothetical protein Ate02nite_62790 [Actinoplanes tereljensis]